MAKILKIMAKIYSNAYEKSMEYDVFFVTL